MAIPPYTALLEWGDSLASFYSCKSRKLLISYSATLFISKPISLVLKIAIISTILTLIIGYSIAYSVAKSANSMERYTY